MKHSPSTFLVLLALLAATLEATAKPDTIPAPTLKKGFSNQTGKIPLSTSQRRPRRIQLDGDGSNSILSIPTPSPTITPTVLKSPSAVQTQIVPPPDPLFPISSPNAVARVCGPQKDVLENSMRKEEACLLLITRAAKSLGEARKAKAQADEDVEQKRKLVDTRVKEARDAFGALRAKQSLIRGSGGRVSSGMRKMIRELLKKFASAKKRLYVARKLYNQARVKQEATGKRVEMLGRDVATLEETLESVRDSIHAQRAEYLRCMGQLAI